MNSSLHFRQRAFKLCLLWISLSLLFFCLVSRHLTWVPIGQVKMKSWYFSEKLLAWQETLLVPDDWQHFFVALGV